MRIGGGLKLGRAAHNNPEARRALSLIVGVGCYVGVAFVVGIEIKKYFAQQPWGTGQLMFAGVVFVIGTLFIFNYWLSGD